MSSKSDWSFKDPDKPNKVVVFSKRGTYIKSDSKKIKKKKKLLAASSCDFYASKEWRILRYRVIKKYGGECMACGKSKKRHGIVIHVDHIKPRSKFPTLAFEFSNLQILCEDCNLGKLDIDQTDWRPENQFSDDAEMEILLNAQNYI